MSACLDSVSIFSGRFFFHHLRSFFLLSSPHLTLRPTHSTLCCLFLPYFNIHDNTFEKNQEIQKKKKFICPCYYLLRMYVFRWAAAKQKTKIQQHDFPERRLFTLAVTAGIKFRSSLLDIYICILGNRVNSVTRNQKRTRERNTLHINSHVNGFYHPNPVQVSLSLHKSRGKGGGGLYKRSTQHLIQPHKSVTIFFEAFNFLFFIFLHAIHRAVIGGGIEHQEKGTRSGRSERNEREIERRRAYISIRYSNSIQK